MQVSLNPCWKDVWPRPSLGGPSIVLEVREGIVDLSRWKEDADKEGNEFAKESYSKVRISMGQDNRFSVFVRALWEEQLLSIFGQVVRLFVSTVDVIAE